ncbi:MAG: alanine racemase [Pseudomonadota bacterium]
MTVSNRLDRLSIDNYLLPSHITDTLLSPALIIYLPKVRANIAQMLRYVDGEPTRWRPHLKTAKTPRIFEEYANAGCRHFKCATPREASVLYETLAAIGVDDADLVVAYPHRGPALRQLGGLADRYRQFRTAVVCEDPTLLDDWPTGLDVFIDLNPGMNRTGLPITDHRAIDAIAAGAGEKFRGLHFYDGHIHDETSEGRRAAAHSLYARLVDARERLVAKGIPVGEVITSGTPTFRYALDYAPFAQLDGGRHSISPGTVVFHDMQYDALLEDVELTPAAVLFSRVVSHPAAHIVTSDAGSKSLACEAGQPVAFAVGHQELTALGPSEEHLPWQVERGPPPERGHELYLVPRHVCPTVNLAEHAIVVDDQGAIEVCDVTARAHDLQFPAG